MNNKCTIGQFIGLLLGWATWLLCGCSDDFQTVPSSEGDKTDILVSLKILPPGMESPLTRSVLDPIEEEGEYELGTTEAEHQINSLTLFMMNVINETEIFETSRTISAPEKAADGFYTVTFELKGVTGVKHFYLGANLKEGHQKAFETRNRIFDAGQGQDGHNIVGGLMTVDHENNGEGSDIAMTAIITNEDSKDIYFNKSIGSEIKIDNPVKLVRTVAKVLLTCVSKEDDPNYVKVIDSNDYETKSEENTGWIKLANVNYMLNVLNRKTYMDYREEGTGNSAHLTDPNYAMSDFIEKRDNGGYGLKDLANYQANFLYYDTQQMVEMLQETKGERCITRKATLFDESKVKENDQNHYTEGLYCPENMVSNDMPKIPAETFASVNRFVTTHVMVGAKYTPKKIWVNENDKLVEKKATTEDEALKFLEDLTDTEYLPGTFWQANDTKKYYSLSGMRKQLQDEPDTEFNRYDGGWGYYYTYIDGEANDKGTIDYANETRWGIKRNHYYILKVNQFVAPGSAFPGNEVMRIHSELIDWKDKGSSEVEIKVPQNSEKEVQP